MGLTDRQLLWRVEVPLALPEIMAGLRIAVDHHRRASPRSRSSPAPAGSASRSSPTSTSSRTWSWPAGSPWCSRRCSTALILLAQRADHALDAGGGGAMNARSRSTRSSFIFNEHESPAGGAQVGGLASMWELIWEHLQLSVVALAIACAIVDPARALARPHRQGRLPRDQRVERRARGAEPRADRLLRRLPRRGLHEPHARARAARDPADPHEHLHGRAPGRPRHASTPRAAWA